MNRKLIRSAVCLSILIVVLLASVAEIMPARANDLGYTTKDNISDSANYISLFSQDSSPDYMGGTQDAVSPEQGEIDNTDSEPETDSFDYSKIALLKWVGPGEPGTYAEYQQSEPTGPLNISPVTPQPQTTIQPQGAPRILVICNSALYPSIQTRLTTYATDVTARGYQVDLYQFTSGTAVDLKGYIQSQSLDLAGCVLVGNIPAAWFEVTNDYNVYGYQSFPCDLFFMDLDGSWTDADSDVIYDAHSAGTGDEGPEIFVARIDASRVSGNQATLVNSYFDRLHTYYDGTIRRTLYGLTYTEDDWSGDPGFLNDIGYTYGLYSAIAAPDTSRDDYLNNRLPSTTYEFIQLSCHSNSSGHSFTRGGWLSSSDVKNAPPRAMLYNLFCCSATRFTDSNCLGCSYIFNNSDSALAVVGSTKIGSMLQFSKFYRPFGQDKTFGKAFQEWFDYLAPYDEYEMYWHYGMNIIGDPLITICTQTATAPPQLTNSTGATNITAGSAMLNGELTDLGGDFPMARIYYGTTDGGTTAENWQYSIDAGYRPIGPFYKDVSGLMVGTDYYYRCYAANSAGGAWADQSSQFTTLPGQKIIGADDADITSTMGANYFVLARFHGLAYSYVSQIKIKCTGPGYIKTAIYEDSNGQLGPLMNDSDGEFPVTAGWNTIPLPSTGILGTRYYWLAFNSSAPVVGSAGNTGTVRLRAANYSTFSFPYNSGAGFSSSNENLLLAGWGIPPPLTVQERFLPEGLRGAPYNLILVATGGTESYTWSLASGSLPPGLTLNSASGIISGTPTTNGWFYSAVRVDDGLTSATDYMGIHIVPVLQKLFGADDAAATGTIDANTFVLSRFIATTAGEMTQVRLNCIDNGCVRLGLYTDNSGIPGNLWGGNYGDSPVRAGWNDIYLWNPWINEGTPYWLGFVSSAPVVGYAGGTGTTKYKSFDYSTFTCPGTAGTGFTDSSLNVLISAWGQPDLIIITDTLPMALSGTPYSYTLQATGGYGSGTYNWSINSGSLPPGLAFSSTGLISGLPTTTGVFNFTAQVTDGSRVVAKSLSLAVVNPQRIVGTDTSGTGLVGANYINLSKFTAAASSTVKQIRVYGTANGNVKVAIYQDSNGQPGSLMTANNNNSPVTAGQWNNITITDTPIISGNAYWLGAIMDTNSAVTKVVSPNPYRYKAQTYSGFSWPGTVTGLATADSIYVCLSGWGPPPPLSIVTSTLPDGYTGTPYSQALQAIGGSGNYTWSITNGSLPAGLVLTPSSGLISGTPTTTGTSSFTVQVNDGSASATRGLSIKINTPSNKLLGTDTSGNGLVGANYVNMSKFTATATGTVNRVMVYGTAAGNVKVAIYQDSNGQPGPLMTANNNSNPVTAGQWSNISMTDTPVISGNAYWLGAIMDTNSAVTKIVSPNPYRYKSQTYSGFNWPGTVSGLSTADSVYLCIACWGVAGPIPLNIATTSLANGNVGAPYSQTLQAVGGSGLYTWSISAGSLPSGLSLTPATGVISGTPTGTGTSSFTAQVNDGSTNDTQPLSITITVSSRKLLGTDTSGTGLVGANYINMSKFTATATGTINQVRVYGTANGAVKVAIYADSNGQPGALISANNNNNHVTADQWTSISITGTPVISGNAYWLAAIMDNNSAITKVVSSNPYRYTSQAYDGFDWPPTITGLYTADSVFICIAGWGTGGPTTLDITTTSLPYGNVGFPYYQTLQATGGTGSYTWSIIGTLPDGLTLNSSTGLISGTPTSIGTSYFTAQVNDGAATDTQPLSITVDVPSQKLIGTDTSSTGIVGANYINLSKFVASSNGSLHQIRIYSAASGNVKVAIYADSGGQPGRLLNANNGNNPVVAGQWNNISITGTPVYSGTSYWLGAIMDTNSAVTKIVSPNPYRYKSQTYNGFSWPDALTGLSTADSIYICMSGWGTTANVYTNQTYGFSMQYPNRYAGNTWTERPELITTPYHLAAFGVPGFVPDLIIAAFDADAPITSDWILTALQQLNCQNPKVASPLTATTLLDGTPAVTYTVSYITATGYEVTAFCLDADNSGNRIHVMVFTIDAFVPYDEAFFSEIAHTLIFTGAP